MEPKYNHLLVEKDKNKKWIDHKYFLTHDQSKPPFSIILPPPNVTGKLHLGHAWDGFLQDTMIRYKKLQGYDVCFVPGMDHAGIATQAKVEEKLAKSGITKYDLGRQKFLEKALEWKEEYAKLIHQQWAKLGLALDYNMERFTLDQAANQAVNQVFISMYEKGLIYRGVRPINWDPKLKTALSNIEVIARPTKSKMYYVKYYFENSDQYLVVATTRIETIFSDVAIAINPNDQSKIHLVNQKVINPLTKKLLPIITDDYIDINFGTGCMKVSAHATNDIDIILKNNLEIIECIDQNGLMNERGLFTKGLDRQSAREVIFDYLQKANLIERVEEIENNVSYSERSNEVIEILVMPQWFVKMDLLAKQLLDHLDSEQKVKIYPSRFENTLRLWMEDVRDWTISRQLWWGHQIPAWYKDDQIKVQVDSPGPDWTRDSDVLDTWFSSALCPFSFLGWPEKTAHLDRYFPTSLLVTGYDIIFFWVARMYFQSLEFMNNLPFKDLLIHGLIRDEQGRKMSKSLGNGIDPMEVIDQYGADALRWFLLTNSAPGQDINYSQTKVEAAWNLNNKLWNIARFIKMMDQTNEAISASDIWIVNKLINLKTSIDQKIDKYEFTIIGKELYQFIFNDFSSWYIEFSKIWKNQKIALLVLKNLLILIHPFLPFISDHLYQEIFNEELLEAQFDLKPLGQENQVNLMIDVISLIREARATFNLSHKDKIEYCIQNLKDESVIAIIDKLANASWKDNNGILFTTNDTVINIYLSEELKSQEKAKTNQEIIKLEAEIKRSQMILNNPNFINKAAKEKVQIEQEKYQKYQNQLEILIKKLRNLD